MPLPDLLAALEAEAAEQRARHLERADAEAERIRSNAEESVRRRRADAVARTERQEAEAARRSVSTAFVEAARSSLEARARVLLRVRRAVEARVAQAGRDPTYRDAVRADVGAALARLPVAAEALVASELVDLVEAAVREHAPGRILTVPVPGMAVGFRLVAGDGSAEVDATLETRLELAWPWLAVRLVGELDGAGAGREGTS